MYNGYPYYVNGLWEEQLGSLRKAVEDSGAFDRAVAAIASLGGCQNCGPFVRILNARCCIIIGT